MNSERNIQISNMPEFDSFEKARAESALSLSFDKLQRIANNELLLNVHFKQNEGQGRKIKHEVHLKLSLPGKTLVASEAGWNSVNVLQAALNTLEREATKSVKRR